MRVLASLKQHEKCQKILEMIRQINEKVIRYRSDMMIKKSNPYAFLFTSLDRMKLRYENALSVRLRLTIYYQEEMIKLGQLAATEIQRVIRNDDIKRQQIV